jgi:probable addiction module antidote protein
MAKTRSSAADPRFGTPESIADFLNEAFETNYPALIVRTIGVVARAKGMSEISRKTNRSREALYRSSGTVSSYGAAGALIALLLWVYYSAQILLLGAEFTEAYANYRKNEP